MFANLKFSEEVEQALANQRPIVALESTVISHGLPPTENIEVASTMESVIREHGATPATIAIFKGQIHVGLTSEQIVHLGTAPNIRKCSIRDLPIVVANKEDGATTVAATMRIAHWAGIKIFATGGIGGVHLGYPFDVSADLGEFGRTPVTVICAGAKAILDLPLTLEKLETFGVPIIGYQTAQLPAFYYRESGYPIDTTMNDPEAIGAMIRWHHQLGLENGILVTNPIPAEYEWPKIEAEAIIKQAIAEADIAHVNGKLLTPYLLDRVSELSNGKSKRANIALLFNNARLAAQIARAVDELPLFDWMPLPLQSELSL